MRTLTNRVSACLAIAAMTVLGSAPATALPAVDIDEDVHAGLHDGGLHAEVSVSLFLNDGTATLFDDSVGTGPVDVPVACSGTCTIGSASVPGYTPGLAVVASGSDVVWTSSDVGHVQRETSTPAGSPTACFSVPVAGGGTSDPVTFAAVGGTLTATVNGVTATCLNAVAIGDGFLVPYHCTLHPTMRGFILVVA